MTCDHDERAQAHEPIAALCCAAIAVITEVRTKDDRVCIPAANDDHEISIEDAAPIVGTLLDTASATAHQAKLDMMGYVVAMLKIEIDDLLAEASRRT